jgi:hypothetical protein
MQASRNKLRRKQQDKRTEAKRTENKGTKPGRPPNDSAESSAASQRRDQFLRAHAGLIVALLCVYAGLRILIFAAAFPLFNNVDEERHLAAIRMYAGGQWPGKDLPAIDPELAKLYAVYGTWEYLVPEKTIDEAHLRTPFYQLSAQEAEPHVKRSFSYELSIPGYEAQSTPLYYLLGAGWYRLGEALGIQSWRLPYWIRLLNPAAYVLLVWVSYRFVRTVYPERMYLWLGVPALLAVFPQDVFFGINRDVLSAPMTAVILLLMVKALKAEKGKGWLLAAASLLVGLAFLVNVSNCVLFGALAATLWFWARRSDETSRRKAGIAVGSVFASMALPLLWMVRNYAVMGDLTGSHAKIDYLGWTVKPLGEIFDHPLFSFDGLSYFLVNLVQWFWRGEYTWHGETMRWAAADWVYFATSVLMFVAFTVQFFRRWKSASSTQRLAESAALLLVITSVLFMAAISLPFNFPDNLYPSRTHPFFVSGRIISGVLLPFVLIYVSGMEFLLTPIRKWVPPAAVLVCLMVFITITEFQVRRVAFSSTNNFFALTAWYEKH